MYEYSRQYTCTACIQLYGFYWYRVLTTECMCTELELTMMDFMMASHFTMTMMESSPSANDCFRAQHHGAIEIGYEDAPGRRERLNALFVDT